MSELDDKGLQKSLPARCYLTDEFFAEEQAQLFRREWFCVGRTSDVPEPGDYLRTEIGPESLLLVRSDDGIHAFHNVCRHRGAELVPASDPERRTGRFRNGIRCPYHSWRYSLDGRLTHTPHIEMACDDITLHEAEVATWGGFVFVRIEAPDSSASLISTLGDIDARTCRYPLAELGTGHRIDYQVAANWKVLLENYNECYHCAGVHPELCRIVPAFRDGGGAGLDWDRGIPHREGANTFTLSGTTNRAPFPELNDDERTRHKGELIYPNLMLSLAMDHAAAFTLFPRGPQRTDIRCDFLFHPDALRASDFDPVRCGRILGHHQSPGLGNLRKRAAWDGIAIVRTRLLRADGGSQPRYSRVSAASPRRRRAALNGGAAADYPPSWYAASVEPDSARAPLRETVSTDVAIIGAGFTGIATALECAARGIDCVIVEARRVGWGASGRNGGQLLSGGFGDPETLGRRYGSHTAEVAARVGRECVKLVRDRIAEHGIDCEFQPGAATVAISPNQLRRLERRFEARCTSGGKPTWYDSAEIHELVASDRYIGGFLDPDEGHLHPLKLCLAEAKLAELAGVRIFENSPVLDIGSGSPADVRTSGGKNRRRRGCRLLQRVPRGARARHRRLGDSGRLVHHRDRTAGAAAGTRTVPD